MTRYRIYNTGDSWVLERRFGLIFWERIGHFTTCGGAMRAMQDMAAGMMHFGDDGKHVNE